MIETISVFRPNENNMNGVSKLKKLHSLSKAIITKYYKPPMICRYHDCLNNSYKYQDGYGGKIIGGYYLLSDNDNEDNFVAIKHFVIERNNTILDITPNHYFDELIYLPTNNYETLLKSPDYCEFINQELIPYHNVKSNL